MKKLLSLVLLLTSGIFSAQSNAGLIEHYQSYYKQMKIQSDVQGIINAMTHLNVLSPSSARKDTLAYIYMSEGKYIQALNTIGFERKALDSEIGIEVKAISLKALKEFDLAIAHYEDLFKRNQNAFVAYDLAELYLQTQKLEDSERYINYGLANSEADMKKAFYESQQPYEVALESAFMYLNSLFVYNKDKQANIDAAIDILDETLKKTPDFGLVKLTKTELLRQKKALTKPDDTNK